MKRRAIFLDRDGTINHDVGYVTAPEQFRLYDFAAPAISLINRAGWLAIVVTNQAAIARGLTTADSLAALHQTMTTELARDGARIDAIYYCPHYPADPGTAETGLRVRCACRKPEPGLLHQAAREHGLDLTASWMVGDRYRDLAAGFAAGARGVLVRTGHGTPEFEGERPAWPRQPDHIAADLLAAVEWIIETEAASPREEP